MIVPHPLLFEPILKPKVWGGRALARLGKRLPEGVLVGESWELADLAASSVTGGGGGQERSRIAHGPLAGSTLADAMTLWGERLLGHARPGPDGGFPLLVKLLDARQNLSVQVHPTPRWAADHPEVRPKSECWYVLRAEPGAKIWQGLRPGLSRDDLGRLVASDRISEALLWEPAVQGDLHWLPSGTVHALGDGVEVLEVQSPGDTTFRLYDWTREYGRPPRALHRDEAVACATLTPPARPTRLGADCARGVLLNQPDFEVLERVMDRERRPLDEDPDRPLVLHILSGRAELDGCGRELVAGTTCLVPAALTAQAQLRATTDSVRLLLVRPG